ncbi:unnamed protein product [Victoria cruziana]
MASPPSKLYALFLILIVFISTSPTILACGYCKGRHGGSTKPLLPPVTVPPVTVPKLPVPPVTVPKLPVPPVTVPKLPVPPVTVPKLPVPPVTVPKLPVPPVTVPPVTVPPVTVPPVTVPPLLKPPSTPCPPTTPTTPTPSYTPPKCPLNALKLGSCVDLLGGMVHIGLGDPAANKCCPILSGLVELEAAACLCTTIKLKLLSVNLVLPVALELLVTCGMNPPPGFTCPP